MPSPAVTCNYQLLCSILETFTKYYSLQKSNPQCTQFFGSVNGNYNDQAIESIQYLLEAINIVDQDQTNIELSGFILGIQCIFSGNASNSFQTALADALLPGELSYQKYMASNSQEIDRVEYKSSLSSNIFSNVNDMDFIKSLLFYDDVTLARYQPRINIVENMQLTNKDDIEIYQVPKRKILVQLLKLEYEYLKSQSCTLISRVAH